MPPLATVTRDGDLVTITGVQWMIAGSLLTAAIEKTVAELNDLHAELTEATTNADVVREAIDRVEQYLAWLRDLERKITESYHGD